MMRRNENWIVRGICRLGIIVHNKSLEKILLPTKDWKTKKGKKETTGFCVIVYFFEDLFEFPYRLLARQRLTTLQ